MLLELPNEMLTHISSFLPPEDNSALRKTCRRLRAVVDSNGILPCSPERVEIDFEKQVIVTIHKGRRIMIVNGNIPGNEHANQECKSNFLIATPHVLCDVGSNWEEYLWRYVTKVNNYSTKPFKLVVFLHEKEVPEVLLRLRAKMWSLSLHPPTYELMPPVLENWVSENLPSKALLLGFVQYSRDFDKYKNVPKLGCLTTDEEGAAYVLKTLDKAEVVTRKFLIPVGGPKFPAAVRSKFGVDLKDLPFEELTWVIPFGPYTVQLRRERFSGTYMVEVGGIEMIYMAIKRNAQQ